MKLISGTELAWQHAYHLYIALHATWLIPDSTTQVSVMNGLGYTTLTGLCLYLHSGTCSIKLNYTGKKLLKL